MAYDSHRKAKRKGCQYGKRKWSSKKIYHFNRNEKDDFAKEIMERMEELEFDVEDAETFPAFLEQKIKKITNDLKKKNRSLFIEVTDEI